LIDSSTALLPEGVKARRVYLALREDISNGLHAVNSPLPGEQKLAAAFAVSRVTVRRALDALCAEGIVKRRAGSGTVVCDSAINNRPAPIDFNTLMPQLSEMGRNTTAQLLSFTYAVGKP